MKYIIIAISLSMLAGCAEQPDVLQRNTEYLTRANSIIVVESQKCTDAGLDYRIIYDYKTQAPLGVECTKPARHR